MPQRWQDAPDSYSRGCSQTMGGRRTQFTRLVLVALPSNIKFRRFCRRFPMLALTKTQTKSTLLHLSWCNSAEDKVPYVQSCKNNLGIFAIFPSRNHGFVTAKSCRRLVRQLPRKPYSSVYDWPTVKPVVLSLAGPPGRRLRVAQPVPAGQRWQRDRRHWRPGRQRHPLR